MRYNDLTITAKAHAINWWATEYDVANECETIADIEYSLQASGFEFNELGICAESLIEEVSPERMHDFITEWNDGEKMMEPVCMITEERTHNGIKYVGLDNYGNNCWVEEFDTKAECIDWLLDITR